MFKSLNELSKIKLSTKMDRQTFFIFYLNSKYTITMTVRNLNGLCPLADINGPLADINGIQKICGNNILLSLYLNTVSRL